MNTKYRFLSPAINAIAALAVSASAMAGDVYTDSATDLPAGGNNLLNILSVDVSYTSTHIKFSFTLDGISNPYNMNQYAFALSIRAPPPSPPPCGLTRRASRATAA